MKTTALKIPLSALAFGLLFMSQFEPGAFGKTPSSGIKEYKPGREVIERLGPQDDKLIKELEQLEQQVVKKGALTLDEYLEIQGQLDELLRRVNQEAQSSGQADAELFGEILELQEVVLGIDVQ